MDMIQKLTEELEVKKWQVEAAVRLIDEGNTIPFIARYRKEATGSLLWKICTDHIGQKGGQGRPLQRRKDWNRWRHF